MSVRGKQRPGGGGVAPKNVVRASVTVCERQRPLFLKEGRAFFPFA